MKPDVGRFVLALSAAGYPLTQLALRRYGRAGAIVVTGASLALSARDAAMIANGVPKRLRRSPAALLYAELGAGVLTTILTQRLIRSAQAVDGLSGRAETLRRACTGALFGLHTVRFYIYLQPGQGRRTTLPREDQRP